MRDTSAWDWKRVRNAPAGQRSGGFTLVELIVAVSIFAIVMVIAVGSLVAVMRVSGFALVSQTLVANMSFMLDTMTRDIRTGYRYYCDDTVESGGTLVTGTSDCPDGASGLVFTDGETGDRMAYRFNASESTIERRVDTGGSPGSWVAVLSSGTRVETLAFVVEHTAIDDEQQSRARVMIHGETDTVLADTLAFFIQTSVTSRGIDL